MEVKGRELAMPALLPLNGMFTAAQRMRDGLSTLMEASALHWRMHKMAQLGTCWHKKTQ